MITKSTTISKKLQPPLNTRWTPHDYQKKALKFLISRYSAGLLLDPGLGKTSISLAAVKLLFKQKKAKGVLIVAPLRVCLSTWSREITKWADFNDLDAVVLHGPHKEAFAMEKHQVYIINYEGLQWLINRVKKNKVSKSILTPAGKALFSNVDILIWDELSRMKHSDTLRFKLIKPFLRKFRYKWGLTGSPAANGLMDLFGQCFVLDEGITLGPYITHFRAEYFLPDEDGFNWNLKKDGEASIHKRIKPLMLRMEAEDYIDMPAQLDHFIKLDLPDKARIHYDELEKDYLTLISDKLVEAKNAASAKLKCRQLCSGAVYLPQIDPITGDPYEGQDFPRTAKRKWELVHNEKLDALADLVEELQGHQLLIAYEFKHDLERLQARFPGVPHIGSGVSPKRGKELEARWNAGDVRLLCGQPASMAHGLNLQESSACHVAWFTLTWDFDHYDQLNRRLRRQGNTAEHVHVYHMIMRDTVEESVVAALRKKDRTQRDLLYALKTKVRISD